MGGTGRWEVVRERKVENQKAGGFGMGLGKMDVGMLGGRGGMRDGFFGCDVFERWRKLLVLYSVYLV